MLHYSNIPKGWAKALLLYHNLLDCGLCGIRTAILRLMISRKLTSCSTTNPSY